MSIEVKGVACLSLLESDLFQPSSIVAAEQDTKPAHWIASFVERSFRPLISDAESVHCKCHFIFITVEE
jgi:hypothetical protein